MAVAMKQKDLRSDSWNHRGFSPVRMSIFTTVDQGRQSLTKDKIVKKLNLTERRSDVRNANGDLSRSWR
jgi:NifB/MoaA-like Fe-S oxidoreductase